MTCAATGDRCSECGLVLDPATFDQSRFPWAYRHTHGRIAALLATAWRVTIDAKSLRFEVSRRQSPQDAAVFRRGWSAGGGVLRDGRLADIRG